MTVAIGIYQPRKRGEVDDLRRVARVYGVDYTFQVGGFRVEDLPPGFPHRLYRNLDQLLAGIDLYGSGELIALELDTHALPLGRFTHPQDVTYLLGPNTGTIPRDVLDRIGRILSVETPGHSPLNTSAVAAIVLHDHYVTVPQEKGHAA